MDKQRFDHIFMEELKGKTIGITNEALIAQRPKELWLVIESIQAINARTILEIGVAAGGTARFWVELVGSEGRVVGVDSGASPEASLGSPLPKNYTHLSMDSHDPTTLEAIKSVFPEKIDFLFIDGDHSYDGVKQDIEMYFPLVREGGIIAMQDINYPPVKQAWEEINLPNKIYHDYGLGMGIIQII